MIIGEFGGYHAARLSLSVLLMTGCASKLVYDRHQESTVTAGDGVSVIFSANFTPVTKAAAGRNMVGCVAETLRLEFPTLQLVPEEEFIRTTFPGLTPDTAPLGSESLRTVLPETAFRERVASLGVRHLILVSGATAQPDASGGGFCGAWYRGAGCFGFWLWKRETSFAASVYDVREGVFVGRVEARVTGRPWLLVIAIVPLGIPSFTESWACWKLGTGVADFLRGTEKHGQ